MNRFALVLAAVGTVVGVAQAMAQGDVFNMGPGLTSLETLTVDNPGNAPDIVYLGQGPFGAVTYEYRIGTYEVTNAQYSEFLNAKAASDPLGLYNANMGSAARGGITRSGVSGSFTYSVRSNMGNKPVNFVSWYDALRFANWLDNGQAAGDTETGAYTLLGGTPTPSNGNSITRNPGATWFLPSENEWYKAAYYDPRSAAEGGPPGDDHYWFYTMKNESGTLVIASANSVGDISNPGANVANFLNGADWNGQNGNVTSVGSAGPLSASFYGTYDQGGNVWEWNELVYPNFPPLRGLRGGSWEAYHVDISALGRNGGGDFYVLGDPTEENHGYGFRVASVPEPGSIALAVLGGVGLLVAYARRRRKAV